MSVLIRAVQRAELPEILRLWEAAGAESTTTDDLHALEALWKADPSACIVAVDDGRIVGGIIAAWDGWRGHLHRLVVAPRCRRRGIARSLVREAEQNLADLGARRVAVIVVDGVEAAGALWEAAGYDAQTRRGRYVKNIG